MLEIKSAVCKKCGRIYLRKTGGIVTGKYNHDNICPLCRINRMTVRVSDSIESLIHEATSKIIEMQKIEKPMFGDVIGVHRGLYDHYGVYENDECVYEYAAENGDFGRATIHTTTLKKFIALSGNCFVVKFPEKYPASTKRVIDTVVNNTHITIDAQYHLFSPKETIERAKMRLGEDKYHLLMNNCEHFAIWCKTGLHESRQVEEFIEFITVRH